MSRRRARDDYCVGKRVRQGWSAGGVYDYCCLQRLLNNQFDGKSKVFDKIILIFYFFILILILIFHSHYGLHARGVALPHASMRRCPWRALPRGDRRRAVPRANVGHEQKTPPQSRHGRRLAECLPHEQPAPSAVGRASSSHTHAWPRRGGGAGGHARCGAGAPRTHRPARTERSGRAGTSRGGIEFGPAARTVGGGRTASTHRAGRGARAGAQLARVWAGLRGARGSRPGLGTPLRAVVAMYDGSHAMGGVHGVSELHLGLSHLAVERVLPSDSLGDGGARSA